MSRELIELLTQKIEETKRLPVLLQAGAARAVVELAVSIIRDHENRLIALEGVKNGENTEIAGGNGGRVKHMQGLRNAGDLAVGAQ